MKVYLKIIKEFRDWEQSWAYTSWHTSGAPMNSEEFAKYLEGKYDIKEKYPLKVDDDSAYDGNGY